MFSKRMDDVDQHDDHTPIYGSCYRAYCSKSLLQVYDNGKMLSTKCIRRNEVIIPRLLIEHEPASRLTKDSDESVIDLGTADNWVMRQKICQALSNENRQEDLVSEDDLSYSSDIGGCLRARKAIADLYSDQICPDRGTTPAEIVLAAGATYILDALVEALCDNGDLIMIATPYWSGLDLSICIHNDAAVLPIHIPLAEAFTLDCLRYYEAAFQKATSTIKAILVCNPHNPLGNCYPAEVISALMGFCRNKNIHFISDEVYALSLHPMSECSDHFTSALSVPHESDLVHIIYSLSKDFGCNGIRMGALISRNKSVRLSVALSTHSQLSSLTTAAVVNSILTAPNISFVMRESRVALHQSYLVLVSFLRRRGASFVAASAGMFVFAKLCHGDESAFSYQLQLNHLKIASGTSYHFNEPGWYRICYGVEFSILKKGLTRLSKVMETCNGSNLSSGKGRESSKRTIEELEEPQRRTRRRRAQRV